MNHRLANLLLVLASLVATGLLIEGVLRWVGYEPLRAMASGKDLVLRQSSDDAIGYELIPGSEGRAFKTDVKVNSFGFRSPEPRQADDVRRVVVVGDSIAFGSELPADTAFPNLLRRALGQRDHRFDVQNLSLSGYDTLQEVAVLKRHGLPLDPELVIVGFCLNDAGVVSANLEYLERMRGYSQRPWLQASRLGQLVLVSLDRLQGRRFEAAANDPIAFRERYVAQIDPIGADEHQLRALMADAAQQLPSAWYRDEDRVGRLRHAFAELAQLRDVHGFRVLIVVFPWLETGANDRYLHQVTHAIVAREAMRQHLPVLDLLGGFQRQGLVGLRNDKDDPVHPSPAGHRIASELIEGWLDRADWLRAR
jgi:lysophospholipase L1-like esterase